MTFAAGLATEGLKPFAVIYSTFLQRAYDQVVHDVAIQKLPVRFAMDRAGLVGADGATHAGSFDLAYLCCLPNFVVMAASDEAELMHMVATAAAYDDGPIALRYPRGEGTGVALPERGEVLPIGKGRIVREGKEVAILSLGTRLGAALAAADLLREQGISCTVADARFAKPFDTDLVRRLVRHHGMLVTVEEGAAGGFGAQVLHFIANEGLLRPGFDIRTMTLPDIFQEHDDPAEAIRDRRPRRRRHRPRGLDAFREEGPGAADARALGGWRAIFDSTSTLHRYCIWDQIDSRWFRRSVDTPSPRGSHANWMTRISLAFAMLVRRRSRRSRPRAPRPPTPRLPPCRASTTRCSTR